MLNSIRHCRAPFGRAIISRNGALSSPATGSIASKTWIRALGTKPPGMDPLEVIRKECLARNLCDEHGYRRPGVHWVFSIAITPDDITQVCVQITRILAYCWLLSSVSTKIIRFGNALYWKLQRQVPSLLAKLQSHLARLFFLLPSLINFWKLYSLQIFELLVYNVYQMLVLIL